MYQNIREEELKNKLTQDYFKKFDCTKVIGNIDFCVSSHGRDHLWAEAKKGKSDIYKSLAQVILTIGKAKAFNSHSPPSFIGAFDAEKIAFVAYNEIQDIFYTNDFNWNVTPSNQDTKEFARVLEKVRDVADKNSLLFEYGEALADFIKIGFDIKNDAKITIDKNNFVVIYGKWLDKVKPTIAIEWDKVQGIDIIDGDFFLADILSENNQTIGDKLNVLLNENEYKLARKTDQYGLDNSATVSFNDGQKAHRQFWDIYDRPPAEEYQDFIVKRRDLLVPQDVRERKGSFFTPRQWVELSQQYLTDYLGVDWQDEYTIWDCAAGTGNLLNGLTNKYNVWASTLDQADVDAMHERITNGANLLESHVFQFDFLNDDFAKLPAKLQDIINDPVKRKKLVVYINPPYAEAATKTTILSTGENKAGVATQSQINKDFSKTIGAACNELYTQFYLRMHRDLPDSKLATFSNLKYVISPSLFKFRDYFKVDFKGGFICNARTFDNVKGNFPIGFLMWDTDSDNMIERITVDVPEIKSVKTVNAINSKKCLINEYIRNHFDKQNDDIIGWLKIPNNQMQDQNSVFISTQVTSRPTPITPNNVIEMGVYLTARHCIDLTWINNNDQVRYPDNAVNTDTEFQNNCLAYLLFHTSNSIKSEHGTNHWIPFTEQEVNAKDDFESHFMTDFIQGKLPPTDSNLGDNQDKIQRTTPLIFSPEANAVFNAGRALWRYYHQQDGANVNASYYDIRAHFQGRNKAGRMNSHSNDVEYTKLLNNLKSAMKALTDKLVPKIYEYGFLLK